MASYGNMRKLAKEARTGNQVPAGVYRCRLIAAEIKINEEQQDVVTLKWSVLTKCAYKGKDIIIKWNQDKIGKQNKRWGALNFAKFMGEHFNDEQLEQAEQGRDAVEALLNDLVDTASCIRLIQGKPGTNPEYPDSVNHNLLGVNSKTLDHGPDDAGTAAPAASKPTTKPVAAKAPVEEPAEEPEGEPEAEAEAEGEPEEAPAAPPAKTAKTPAKPKKDLFEDE